MNLVVRMIQFQTPDYEAEKKLRSRILREPLGLSFAPDDFARERDDLHFGAFLDGELIGCLILTALSPIEMKMRQVAISPNHQGLGLGRKLVTASEVEARKRGVQKLKLAARETAIPFYLALSYDLEGEPFTEVGLPHRWMTKQL